MKIWNNNNQKAEDKLERA